MSAGEAWALGEKEAKEYVPSARYVTGGENVSRNDRDEGRVWIEGGAYPQHIFWFLDNHGVRNEEKRLQGGSTRTMLDDGAVRTIFLFFFHLLHREMD
jgi:hypothetical protein